MRTRSCAKERLRTGLGIALGIVGLLGVGVGALRLSPVAFDLVIPPGVSTTFAFQVTNDETEPLELRVRLCDWLRDLAGVNRFCEEAGEVARSATSWVEVGPREFTLNPGESQEVRVTLAAPEAAPDGSPLDGSYWTAVMVEAVPPSEGGEQPGTEVVVKRRFGLKIVATIAGTGRLEGQIVALERHGLNPLWLTLDFENRGTLNIPEVQGRVEVRDVRGETLETIPLEPFPVLPGYARRVIAASVRPPGERLPAGDYIVLAVLDYGGEALVGAQLLLRVPALALVPLAEGAGVPQDLDGDGFYEDVDGNGALTEDDPALLGTHLETEAVQNNWPAFDFDNDGDVDFDDVLTLHALRQSQDGSNPDPDPDSDSGSG